jgi:hypothetical protein
VYCGDDSFEAQSEDALEITTYEMEEESRPLIRSWLEEKYSAFLAQK